MEREKFKRISVLLKYARESIFSDSEDEEEKETKHESMVGYSENIVPLMSETQFKSHFRISLSTFEVLLNMLHSVKDSQYYGQPQIGIDKQLMITLWFLANLECLR